MKTSIFDMTLTLPPMVEMVEVEKDMPMGTHQFDITLMFSCAPSPLPYC